MSRRSEDFLITKQFPRREETIVAVASLLKNLTVTGGVRKLMIHDKTAITKIRVNREDCVTSVQSRRN